MPQTLPTVIVPLSSFQAAQKRRAETAALIRSHLDALQVLAIEDPAAVVNIVAHTKLLAETYRES